MNRREFFGVQFFGVLGGVAGLSAASRPASAQGAYPGRPVRILAGFAAGGGVDITARLTGQWLSERLGQPFVTENRTGADGNIATEAAVNAPADGYTLLLATLPNAVNASLYPKLNFVFLRDIAPVAGVIRVPMVVLVHPSVQATTIPELIAYAKANPGKLNYGVGNSTGHIVGEMIKQRAGIDLVRVNYRSNPQAVTDLIAGHISMMILEFTTGMPQIKAQKVRPIAMITKERSPYLPDLPTLSETILPGFDVMPWVGIFGPANMPPEVVKVLATELEKMVSKPDIKEQFMNSGTEVYWIGREQFPDFVKSELVKWTAMIKEAGIEPE